MDAPDPILKLCNWPNSNIIALPLGQQDANSLVVAAQDGSESEDIAGTVDTSGGLYELDGAQVRILNLTGKIGT